MQPDSSDCSVPGYTVDAVVFDGDPSRIYKARRLSDGAPVMLKALRSERAARETGACLKHEFEIARRLSVSSVIRVYALERHKGLPVVVFEDFGGDSLNNIARQRRLPLAEVLRIAIEIAKGLQEIHAANIIHKDINPSNVVYNPATGVVKIIDFGISTYLMREQAALASPQVFEGSLPYISPEQTGRMNRSIDYRTDFYSLGATLYELLAQRPLFVVSEPIEWFHCHIAKEPKPLCELDPTIPRPVSDIVMTLLAKTAEDRYQSAQGILADLQHCLDQLESTGTIKPFVLRRQDVPERFQVPQRLYGRQQEVSQLLASFDRVSQGGSELILVSGYSGIGKTSLIREIYKPITERRGYFVAGKFDQLHRNVPYSALTTALRDLVRQLLTETTERLAEWRASILQSLGPNAQLMVNIIRELELIIGAQPSVPALAPVEAEQRFHRAFHSFIQIFATPKHPLVIFLDDLQWADRASLKLLDLLVGSTASPYLLLIGAYRENEVHPGHPLLAALKGMRERGAVIDEIRLRPLRREHLTELLADTLCKTPEDVAELAEVIERKTAGNPFFTEELLKSLHKEGLISFSREDGSWQWDTKRIRAQQITDNVVDLMAGKLRRLAPGTQELLELAACIGNRFPLSMLALVSEQSPAVVAQRLSAGVAQGLLAPIGDAYQLLELEESADVTQITVEFAFAHDRIQQAAYSLLGEARRRETHLRIGRLLLRRLPPSRLEERLFEVANHLNMGVDLIEDADERAELCRLNLAAGQRAKASSAYQTAYGYLRTAVELLDDQAWTKDYALAMELYAEAAEAAYLSHEDKAMAELLQVGLAGAKNLLDKTKLYLVQISAYVARGDLRRALDIALPLLAKLGHRYPAKPSQAHVIVRLLTLLWRLRGKRIDQLRALPEMTDPYHLAAMSVGERIGRAAMFVEPNLLPLMVFKGVEVSMQKGYANASLTSFAAFGMILAAHPAQAERGQAFGRLALELTERLQAKAIHGRVLHVYNALVRHWREPLRNTLEGLQEAYRLCLEQGDFEYAALAAVVRLSHAFDSGMDLRLWLEEVEECYEAIKPLKQEAMLDLLRCFLQCADNLLGEAEDPARIKGRHYDIERMLQLHMKSGDISLIANDWRLQMHFNYQFGRYQEALACADGAAKSRAGTDGFFHAWRDNMFDSLVRLANVPGADRLTRWRLLRQVARNQSVLKRWTRNCPANGLNKYRLVEAELLRVQGRDFEAHALYDEAIELAHEQGFIHEEALAQELCGLMHMQAGRRALGEPYLIRARNLYQRWGAKAVVDHLEQRFPQIVAATLKPAVDGTFLAPMASVDITSLMKALKAIADEKIHSRMLEIIIATAVEFAGAQRGLLILRNAEGELRIEAEISVDDTRPRILQSLPVTTVNTPQALINYVSRAHTSIVIADATQPNEDLPGLSRDPYVIEHGVRSVLCLPILSGMNDASELIGMLYLENNRASGSFTPERLGTLEIICIAAAGRLELSRKAAIDGLTQLFNHDYFQNVLKHEFASAARHGRGLALILIDIDHFKHFNDKWGHQLGDRVLREVAQLIKNACRGDDTVARYGGEEMAVILPGVTAAEAREVADRIRSAVAGHTIVHEGETLTVTISLGLALLDRTMPDQEALIRRADRALYSSKADGRNRVTMV